MGVGVVGVGVGVGCGCGRVAVLCLKNESPKNRKYRAERSPFSFLRFKRFKVKTSIRTLSKLQRIWDIILVILGAFWCLFMIFWCLWGHSGLKMESRVPSGPAWGPPDGIWTLLESISGSPGEPLGHPGVDFGGPWGTLGPTMELLWGTFAYLGPKKCTKNWKGRVSPKKHEKV